MPPTEDEIIRMVLVQVDLTWTEAQETARGELGPGPEALIVRQCGSARWERAECDAPFLRQWVRDQRGTTEREPSPSEVDGVSVKHRMCSQVGQIWFHVGADKDRVIFTFVVGPRFGRGRILRVVGDHLEPEPHPVWVA